MTDATPVLVFSGTRLLAVDDGGPPGLPRPDDLARLPAWDPATTRVEVGLPLLGGRSVEAHDLPDDVEAPAGLAWIGLRAMAAQGADELFRTAGAALQKIEWLRTHRFCARCGTPTVRHPVHEAQSCPSCNQLHFPRLSPAVIVLVQRGREMLLARSPHFPEGVYSTLAGFVEPGESLEDTIHREIREEVGVEVGNLRYFSSQPWPFPHSLMVGFVADWAAGDIRLDDDEIEDAGWFSPERMPPRLPFQASIARRLVDDFLHRAGRPTG